VTVFGLISLGGQSLLAAHWFIEEISHEGTKGKEVDSRSLDFARDRFRGNDIEMY